MAIQTKAQYNKRLLASRNNNCKTIVTLILLLVALVEVFRLRFLTQPMPQNYKNGRILVMYVFSNTDPVYEQNLQFFIREGMQEDDGCDYVIVIQRGEDITPLDPLPVLPKNARYVYHYNEGYDWGTFGWLINEKKVDINKYDYFLFLNASVRGPFLPTYLKGVMRWVDLFISKLNDKVKLVGPTINCQGTPKDGDIQGEWRYNPHVQSYAMATDKVGLKVLLDNGQVFTSYSLFWHTIYYSELGASLAILQAGYNIGSFMMRYQGVDWNNQDNWGCNDKFNPYGQYNYDGIALHPFEVLFVKVKEHLLTNNRWDFVRTAYKYDEWMTAQYANDGSLDILKNEWTSNPAVFKIPHILAMERRGSGCFDLQYYKDNNQDLPSWDDDRLFEHFVQMGQFEGRLYRFTCEADFAGIYRG
eukprot:TRINITY_DN939_c1_g1_i1.p2 TRINITY_DN939_c1_g1~~TRINITY_DN939_c1_g1_i1.p2  ORF type:complete len:416 (-),score=23.99 TRINITY_DN939_c1_g1_i1:2601-3848(-)